MDLTTLKKIINWLVVNGRQNYNLHQVATDLKLPLNSLPTTPYDIVFKIFHLALKSTQTEVGLSTATSQDELFDVLLTFFEHLSFCRSEFKTLYNQSFSLSDVKMLKHLHSIAQLLFKHHINNSIDSLTYTGIFTHLVHEWVHDTSEDLPKTSHQINKVTRLIYTLV